MENYKEKLKKMYESSTSNFTLEDLEKIKNSLEKLNAAEVSAKISSLGGKDRSSVMLVFSLDKKKDWKNGYIENSRYARIKISYDGVIEMFSGSIKPYMRKTKFKNIDEPLKKINNYIKKVK